MEGRHLLIGRGRLICLITYSGNVTSFADLAKYDGKYHKERYAAVYSGRKFLPFLQFCTDGKYGV